jgi:hypothetical protein
MEAHKERLVRTDDTIGHPTEGEALMCSSGKWRVASGLAVAALVTHSQAWGVDLSAITCGSAKETATLELRCAPGQAIKDVTFASFGTPAGSCGTHSLKISPACHSPVSLEFVNAACIGKQSCNLKAAIGAKAGRVTLTDPCPRKAKLLAASVACAKPGS